MEELLQFLQPQQRLDLKAVSMNNVLSLTGSTEGKKFLLDSSEFIKAIFQLTNDKTDTIAKDAILSIINLTALEDDAIKLYNISKNLSPTFEIIQAALDSITNPDSSHSDPWTMVLSNLTRVSNLIDDILHEITKDMKKLKLLVKSFTRKDYNKKEAKLHYLAPILCNLTQTKRGRDVLCDSDIDFLQNIDSFVSFDQSIVRRGGIIGLLKNICFDPAYHDYILNENYNILYCLLYPLIGPEEYSDEDNDKFPIALQYMTEDKTRESDPDIRKMLLESLLQLCATRKYREYLRAKGTYEILREYHKWEDKVGGDKQALLVCENVVDILIKKEDEIVLDNYREVDVPDDIAKKFIEDDANYLAN